MAKQTDGGRRREAHDTSETIIISLMSSNHSSTAALPSLSICCMHQHKHMAKMDFDTCCSLNSSAFSKSFDFGKLFISHKTERRAFSCFPSLSNFTQASSTLCLQKGHETGFNFDVSYDFTCGLEQNLVTFEANLPYSTF